MISIQMKAGQAARRLALIGGVVVLQVAPLPIGLVVSRSRAIRASRNA
ncbi:hypothetical protein [Actinomadura napierensis]|uniref:Uncharacterized protein n=1 Tax=Actinomadura napierensis TaxID=267854 RepID=A0ABN3A4L6_9ACTN